MFPHASWGFLPFLSPAFQLHPEHRGGEEVPTTMPWSLAIGIIWTSSRSLRITSMGSPWKPPATWAESMLLIVHIFRTFWHLCKTSVYIWGELSQDNKPWLCLFQVVKPPETGNPRQLLAYLSTTSWVRGILCRPRAGPNMFFEGSKIGILHFGEEFLGILCLCLPDAFLFGTIWEGLWCFRKPTHGCILIAGSGRVWFIFSWFTTLLISVPACELWFANSGWLSRSAKELQSAHWNDTPGLNSHFFHSNSGVDIVQGVWNRVYSGCTSTITDMHQPCECFCKWCIPQNCHELQREHYIRMLVADGQGPSISYRKGPMYVSIYVQLFGRGSLNFLAIS